MLCYLVDDPMVIDIANKYWEQTELGWVNPVGSIKELLGLAQSNKVAGELSKIATAHLINARCMECGKPIEHSNRSSANKNYNRMCSDCEKKRLEQIEQEEDRKTQLDERIAAHMKTQLDKRVAAHVADVLTLRIDYGLIGYDKCLLVMALHKSAGNIILMDSHFRNHPTLNLMPESNTYALMELIRSGVIAPTCVNGNTEGYLLENGDLNYYRNEVAYTLIPHKGGTSEDAFAIANQRAPADADLVIKLWYELSTQECMKYLISQCNDFGFPVEHYFSAEAWDEVTAVVRNALLQFSVTHLWAAIWKIVRDAAALSNKQYYNKKKAAATIPGKLARELARVTKGEKPIFMWERPYQQQSSMVADVFSEMFGLAEFHSGRSAEASIRDICGCVDGDRDAQQGELALFALLMKIAIQERLATEVAITYGECRKGGITMMKSIEIICQEYPGVRNAYLAEIEIELEKVPN